MPQGCNVSFCRLLGKNANLFRFIIGADELRSTDYLDDHLVNGHVIVNFLKPPVMFTVYFHDAVGGLSWSLCELPVDVLAHFGVTGPVDIKTMQITMSAGVLWDSWLQQALWNCDLGSMTGVHQRLAAAVENDIMQVSRVRKRNVLHEMDAQAAVDLYLVLDAENYLNLRLQSPANEVRVPPGFLIEELGHLVGGLPLP